MFKTVLGLTAAAALVVAAGQAAAAEVVVKMQDRGSQGMMVFEPATAQLKVGDTVKFIPDSPSHNVESIPGMQPAGAATVKGEMGQPVTVKFTKSGIYGFRCSPHWGFGMSFVAKVGEKPANLAEAQAVAAQAGGMAKKRLTADLAGLQ